MAIKTEVVVMMMMMVALTLLIGIWNVSSL